MKNYDQTVETKHNPNWPYIPDYPYRILISSGSRSEKTNASLNLLMNKQPNVDKIYLYFKDPFESKYQLLINGRENVEIKTLRNPKASINYLQKIVDIYKNLEN